MSKRKRTSTKDKHRLQIDVMPPVVENIDRVGGRLGATSRGEIVRRALALFFQIADSVGGEAKIRVKEHGKIVDKTLSAA